MTDVRRRAADDSATDRSRRDERGLRAEHVSPRALSALRLQRSAGNRAVTNLLGSAVVAQPLLIAPLRTRDQWIQDSTLTSKGLFGKSSKRVEGVERIDKAVGDYEAFGDLDVALKERNYEDGKDAEARKLLEDRLFALGVVSDAINLWKKSRTEKTKGFSEVEALAKEVEDEKKQIRDVVGRWEQAAHAAKLEARGQQMDTLIPAAVRAKKDVDEKASALFDVFMRTFRGQVRYRTTSKTEFWATRSGPMACATFANGFRDFLRRAGLEAQTVPITAANFITVPLGDTFIDAESNGNLSTPEAGLAQTRRFFFSEHHVVAVKGGPHFCPTSGHVTDANGANIVDSNPDYKDFAAAKGGYENARYTVSKIGEIFEGSEYQLKPRSGK